MEDAAICYFQMNHKKLKVDPNQSLSPIYSSSDSSLNHISFNLPIYSDMARYHVIDTCSI